jgi:putative hemolysin
MEILLIVLLILLNGFFAMSEIAVVSARRARLDRWARHGDRRARAALALHDTPNVFLSTIQVGITLIGILAGAVGEAAVADDVARLLARSTVLAPYAGAIASAAVVFGITYLSLVVGELVPKRLALLRPERIARAIALPMSALARIGKPVVRVLSASVDAALALLRVGTAREPGVTEEEVQALIEEGARTGVFLRAERDLLKNVIRLADRPLATLMTRRDEIVWLDAEAPLEHNRELIARHPYSRFVLARGSLEHPLGIVHAKDLLAQALSGQPLDLVAAATPAPRVRSNASPLRVLELFQAAPVPMALVVNAVGEVKGLVTPHDLLEAIVGVLPAAGEVAEPDVIRRADGSLLLDGGIAIEELRELLEAAELPEGAGTDYQTLAGFVLAQVGRVPQIGESFEWSGYRFEVVDMDNRRIDRVLVARAEAPAE